jgi:hypothetical protein
MSLNPAQAEPGPNLFWESTMKKPSTLDQQLAELKISELQSLQHVEAKQKKMLRLMKRSQVDPISYAGLEYCGPDHCGRVGCSEACWFGTLRRRVPDVLAIRRLMEQQEGTLHKIKVWKPIWGCPFGWLHCIKPGISRAEMTRIFNSMCSPSVVAVGTLKIIPVGRSDKRYFGEIHAIVGGEDRERLEATFSSLDPGDVTVAISEITDLNLAIDEVTSCISMQPRDEQPPGQTELTEFYAWLANMKLGTRLFRYGCDENFDLITYRKITWKPRLKKHRPWRRRRYYKRRKRTPYRPWNASSGSGYYDQE